MIRMTSRRRSLRALLAASAAAISTLAGLGTLEAQDAPDVEPAPAEPAIVEPPIVEPVAVAVAPATPVVTATPEAPAAAKPWTEHLQIAGGAILWYYQPLQSGPQNDFNLYFANLVLDGTVGKIGLHVEPRFRATKLRPFFDGPTWVEEAYAHVAAGPVTFKVGKVYSHLGLFWDNCFYGNVQVFDGLKLAPDYGISAEGSVRDDQKLGLRYWGQFFLVDGATNVSLPGRDTLSIPGARRRNEVVARAEPFVRFSDDAVARLGLSGQYLQADLPGGKENVFRGAVDVSVTRGALGAWAEYLHQDGAHVAEFPVAPTPATDTMPGVAGRSSASNDYVLVGGEYHRGPLVGRYNFSLGSYNDEDVRETIHEPAIGYTASENLTVLAELVLWDRSAPEGDATVDRSLNVTLHGHF